MKHLYLDDMRTPVDPKWDVVRNYDEFKEYLVNNFPFIDDYHEPVTLELHISFDHDLADEHYVPQELWTDYAASVKHQDSQQYKEKTGLDCAKLLAEYNILPDFCNCHSWNPVGKANIIGFIDGWYRFNNVGRQCSYDNISFTTT